MIQMTEQEFQMISLFIRRNYGINLSKKKYLIESKLWIELVRAHVDNYSDYWQRMQADVSGEMKQRMLDLLTTNYSYFMREEKHFSFMQEVILPQIASRPLTPFRILCAGCASGQEAYTLAMYLLDARQLGRLKNPFEITAVDISQEAVRRAQKGTYGSSDYARLPAYWRENYCEPFREGQFTVRSIVKEKVIFSHHNLMEPLPYAREMYQIVFCRNVLIYILEPERQKVLENIVNALQPEGYLFIGHTESLMQDVNRLRYVQPAIYRKEDSRNCRIPKSGL